MLTARHAAIRLLKLMMVASLVLPAVLFAFTAWVGYRNFERVTDERIDRSLDILHEHALKVLQTVERVFGEIDEIMRGMSDDDIRLNEVRCTIGSSGSPSDCRSCKASRSSIATATRWSPACSFRYRTIRFFRPRLF